MKYYKIRAFVFVMITRIVGKILFVEIPPILSVSAIIDRENKLLLINHSYIKGYGLPGGIVKAGEDIEMALRREVKEETGLDVTDHKYFTSTAFFHRGFPLISVTFIVSVSGSEKESSEGKIIWMSAGDAIGKMAYSGVNTILQKYVQK